MPAIVANAAPPLAEVAVTRSREIEINARAQRRQIVGNAAAASSISARHQRSASADIGSGARHRGAALRRLRAAFASGSDKDVNTDQAALSAAGGEYREMCDHSQMASSTAAASSSSLKPRRSGIKSSAAKSASSGRIGAAYVMRAKRRKPIAPSRLRRNGGRNRRHTR